MGTYNLPKKIMENRMKTQVGKLMETRVSSVFTIQAPGLSKEACKYIPKQ